MSSLPLKVHGGKAAFNGKLANWLVSLMPRPETYKTYLEPYFGGGSVLFARPMEWQHCEVVCDLDGELMNFWAVLRDGALFKGFRRIAEATPFSEKLWHEAKERIDLDIISQERSETHSEMVRRAVDFLILARQSLAGRCKSFAPISTTRTRRGMCEQSAAWLSAVEGLTEVHRRLQPVAVLDAGDALYRLKNKSWSSKSVFAYLDPPYLDETRTAPNVYRHEADRKHHEELLATLATYKGKFLLSGYRSKLYDDWSKKHGFKRADMRIVNNASGSKSKKTMVESAWLNY